MDDALVRSQRNLTGMSLTVLILVVMDDALVHNLLCKMPIEDCLS